MRLHPRLFPDFAAFALTLALALFAFAGPPLHAQPGAGPISGGGGGGGLPGNDEVTEAMLKSVNAATDEYMLTYESTTGDFEWQPAATGTIGGSTGATDNAILRADGAGGVTAQSSAVTIADTTGDLQWEGTTADDFEGNFTFADPTEDWTWDIRSGGQLVLPHGSYTFPGLGIALPGAIPGEGWGYRAYGGTGWLFFQVGYDPLYLQSPTSLFVRYHSNAQLSWTSSGGPDAAGVAGLARFADGVMKATDGSTGIRGLLGGGTAVASATALPVPTGRVFHVTGTTTLTSVLATNFQSGVVVTLIFDGILTVTDGSNLKLAGDFVTTADDVLTLAYDGTSFFEVSRSVN